jgi:hypothetical protein
VSGLTRFDVLAGELLEYVIATHHRPELDDGELAAQLGIRLDELAEALDGGDA